MGLRPWRESSRMGAGEQTKQDLGVREETSRPACPARPRVGCLSSHAGCKKQQLGSRPPPPPRSCLLQQVSRLLLGTSSPVARRPWTGRRPLAFHRGPCPPSSGQLPPVHGERDALPDSCSTWAWKCRDPAHSAALSSSRLEAARRSPGSETRSAQADRAPTAPRGSGVRGRQAPDPGHCEWEARRVALRCGSRAAPGRRRE